MSYEINIIVINQKKPVTLDFSTEMLLINEIDDGDKFGRYFDMWPYFSNTKGILYDLVTDDVFYWAYQICEEDLDPVPPQLFPVWVSEDVKDGDLRPFIVKPHFYQDFVKALRFLLTNAPEKRILFQTRFQGYDEEIIMGVIKINTFLDMLSKKQILFNVCYIIEDE